MAPRFDVSISSVSSSNAATSVANGELLSASESSPLCTGTLERCGKDALACLISVERDGRPWKLLASISSTLRLRPGVAVERRGGRDSGSTGVFEWGRGFLMACSTSLRVDCFTRVSTRLRSRRYKI